MGEPYEPSPSRCYRSPVTGGACQVCGAEWRIMHWPAHKYRGVYCGRCPACNRQVKGEQEETNGGNQTNERSVAGDQWQVEIDRLLAKEAKNLADLEQLNKRRNGGDDDSVGNTLALRSERGDKAAQKELQQIEDDTTIKTSASKRLRHYFEIALLPLSKSTTLWSCTFLKLTVNGAEHLRVKYVPHSLKLLVRQ